MGLQDNARRDAQRYLSDKVTGFAETVTLKTPDGLTSLEFSGLCSTRRGLYDEEGAPANIKVASCAIAEQDLIDAGFTYLDGNTFNLMRYRLTIPNAAGAAIEYKIEQQYPDRGLGCIVLILGDYTDEN